MTHERGARIGCDQAALVLDVLLDGQVVVLVIKVCSYATVLILYVIFDSGSCQNFFSDLELKGFKDRLIVEKP